MSSAQAGPLALGIVGAVIGAPFGMSAIGFALGSAIGGLVFAPDGPITEGPRLGDTSVSSSSLGRTISENYGITRTAGNMIWSGGLKEVQLVEEAGGKGGAPAQNISYTYSTSFLIAFGYGPAAKVSRIWADGRPIYDTTGTGNVDNGKHKFRFYRGTSTQEVDSLYDNSVNRRLAGFPDVNEGTGPQAEYFTIQDLIAQADEDVSNPRAALYAKLLRERVDEVGTPILPSISYVEHTYERDHGTEIYYTEVLNPGYLPEYRFAPAYRDLCYIVFDDMDLTDFGNRVPNITAEIAWGIAAPDMLEDGVTQSILEREITERIVGNGIPESVALDTQRRRLYTLKGNLARRFSYDDAAETLNISFSGGTVVERLLGVDYNGDIVSVAETDGTANALIKLSSGSFALRGVKTPAGNNYTMNAIATDSLYGAGLESFDPIKIFATVTTGGYVCLFRTDTTLIRQIWGYEGDSSPSSLNPDTRGKIEGTGPIVSAGIEDRQSRYYIITTSGTTWRLYKGLAVASVSDRTGVFTPSNSIELTDTGSLVGGSVSSVLFDNTSQTLYLLLRKNAGGGFIRKYDQYGTLIYETELVSTPPSVESGINLSAINNGSLTYASGNDVVRINLVSGRESIRANSLSGDAAEAPQIYNGPGDTLVAWVDEVPKLIAFNRTELNSIQQISRVRDIISHLCFRCGMEPDEYDVSNLSATTYIRGYTIARPSSGRDALQNIMLAYFIDGVESDWTLKFTERSTTPIRTISENDLGVQSGPTGEVNYIESRTPEYDLPGEVNLVYTDPDRDYQQGTAHMRRISNPTPTMFSNSSERIEIPMVLTELEARAIAQRLLYLAWMTRDASKFVLPWSQIDIDAGDVVSIEFNDGRTVTERLTNSTLGANYNVEIETTRSGDPIYVANDAAPLISSNVPTLTITVPVYSELFILDIPLLYDFHDTGRSATRFYAAVGANKVEWLSASLYSSMDGNNYTRFDTVSVDVTWGEVLNTLAPPRALWTTDHDNTITIRLSVDNGDVSSTTRANVLNSNLNRALIFDRSTGIGEIIKFQDATYNMDGTITLSTLLRGVRGTDYAVSSHVEGETFILLSEAATIPEINELAVIGTTEYFKAVSRGSLISSTTEVPATFTGRDLKPYAPSRVKRTDDTVDLTITWNRRTRVGGNWNMIGSGIETVPLNEDSEAYEFYLLPKGSDLDDFDPLDASTYEVKVNTTTPTTTITAATLGTFGYALSDRIQAAVYQVSAQVGRGFPRLVSLAP